MPLSSGYGVLIGTLNSFERDNINDYGQYYHENVKVNAPAGLYRCAIDVDSKQSNDGIEWRVVPLGEPDMKGVASMPDGWHLLPSNDKSIIFVHRHSIAQAAMLSLSALTLSLNHYGKCLTLPTIHLGLLGIVSKL